MDIFGGIKKVLDVVQPVRKASRDVGKVISPAPVADPTGIKAATAAGATARQEAINRGKVVNTPTGDFSKKKF